MNPKKKYLNKALCRRPVIEKASSFCSNGGEITAGLLAELQPIKATPIN